MKLYEKLGVDLSTAEGLGQILYSDNENLRIKVCNEYCDIGKKGECDIYDSITQYQCVAKHLLSDIPKKKRWELIKNDEDVRRLFYGKSLAETFACTSSAGYTSTRLRPLADYLLEEVEE